MAKPPTQLFRAPVADSSKQDYILRLVKCRIEKISGQNQNQCQLEIALGEADSIHHSLRFGAKMTFVNTPKPKTGSEAEFSSGDEGAETT